MAARKKPLLDTSTATGKKVQKRLEKELIIWLATCAPDGRPHAVPVWFLWDGKTFLIYSVPGQKVNDIAANPNVQLHFNTTPDGDEVVRFDGDATRLKRYPLAHRVPTYIRKYARLKFDGLEHVGTILDQLVEPGPGLFRLIVAHQGTHVIGKIHGILRMGGQKHANLCETRIRRETGRRRED